MKTYTIIGKTQLIEYVTYTVEAESEEEALQIVMLKGMNIEEMKKYVEENISKMKAVNSEYSANLEDEVMYAEEEWNRYYNESSQTVIEELTEEDLVQNNREEDEDDEEDED